MPLDRYAQPAKEPNKYGREQRSKSENRRARPRTEGKQG